jgi:hypothetical protein
MPVGPTVMPPVLVGSSSLVEGGLLDVGSSLEVVGSSLEVVGSSLELVGSSFELVGSGLVEEPGPVVVVSSPPRRLERMSPRDCLLVVDEITTGGGTVVSGAGIDSVGVKVDEVVLSN